MTRKSDLAVRALRRLADSSDKMKGPAIASLIGCSSAFLSHVLTPLVKAGWIRSEPGPAGGYSLQADLATVSVLAVIEAVEGPTDSGLCVLADHACDAQGHCALHDPWVRARSHLLAELDSTMVADAPLSQHGDASV